MKFNTTIIYYVSTGSASLQIPSDIVGMSINDAQQALNAIGITKISIEKENIFNF